RMATLVAFAHVFEAVAQDDALDLLEHLITQYLARAERKGKKGRLCTLRDLDAAAYRLKEACQVILDPSSADSELRARVFARVPREQLEQDVVTVTELTRPEDDNGYEQLLAHYSTP